MWFKKEIKQTDCVGIPLHDKSKMSHEVFCVLCGTPRKMWVSSAKLTSLQHIQTVLFSVFLAWALFPLIGIASLFLYPFVWAAADLGKKALFRRGAQCKSCGFDAVTYKKDIRKAKEIVKSHIEQLPKNVVFKNGYRKKSDEDSASHYPLNL
jgi:hypothetical protein